MENKKIKKSNNPPKKSQKGKGKTETLPLVFEGETYHVLTTYKRIKSIRMYIRRGDHITLSVPLGTKRSDIERFCRERHDAILGHITALYKRPVAYAVLPVKDGDSFPCFGETLSVVIREGKKAEAMREGKVLYLTLRDPKNEEAVNRLFSRWQKETTKTYMTYLCQCHFDKHFWGRGVAFPKIEVKPLWARWGSCYYEVGRILFSTALMYTHPDHANYVALHEMAHLVHGDHSQRFYGLLDQLMPDWRDQRAKASVLLARPEEKGKRK